MTGHPSFFLRHHKLTPDQLMAAQRFRQSHNSMALPPTMRKVLHEALIEGKSVQLMERQNGWPARSAKAIVGVLLDVLAEWEDQEKIAPEPDNSAAAQLDHLTAAGFDQELARHMRLFGLNYGEARLLETLRRAPGMALSREVLHARLYAHDAFPPSLKIIDVRICQIRKKIAGTGIEIRTIHGMGWQLDWPDWAGQEVREEWACSADELLEFIDQPEDDLREMGYMQRFDMTRIEARLFDALLTAKGRVLSKDFLTQRLYSESAEAPASNAIHVLLTHVRRKIRPAGLRIENQRGAGWRLVIPAPRKSEPQEPPP